MLELSRILTAGGATLAGTAFTVYGIGHSVRNDTGWEVTLSVWGMIIGLIALAIGWFIHTRLAEEE